MFRTLARMGVLRGSSGGFAALVLAGCSFSGAGLAVSTSGEDTTGSTGGTGSAAATTEDAPPTTQGPGDPTATPTNDTPGESTVEVTATTGPASTATSESTDGETTQAGSAEGGSVGESTEGESTEGESSTGESSTGECVAVAWYADSDNDGRGDAGAVMMACAKPPGYVDNSDDCNDDDGQVSPVLPEVCDNKDNDCDELVDEYSAMNKACGGCTIVPDDEGTPTRAYYFCDMPKKSWDAAKSLCDGKTAALVADEADPEHEFLNAQLMILGAASGGWWTGGFAPGILGYQWLSGVGINGGDGRWDYPQLGSDPNKCVQLLSPAVMKGGHWTARSCDEVKPYICEQML